MNFSIHDLNFNVKSDNLNFMNYLNFRLEKYKSKNTKNDLTFRIFFKPSNISTLGFDKISSSLYTKDKEFILKYSNLLIYYNLNNKNISIDAYFNPGKIRHFGRIVLKGKKCTYSDYYEFFIIRKVIQNTFFAILEKKGLNIIHASTVKNKNASTLFFGLGGLGKTTLALSLVLSEKLKLQGDNFVLIDNKYIYSYLEPTRITKYTKNKINLSGSIIEEKIKTFGKENFYLHDKFLFNGKSKIKNIIFPILSNNLSLKRITKNKAIEIIENSMKILKETPEFTETNFIFPKKKINLDKNINFYKLSYKNLNDAKKILKKIL